MRVVLGWTPISGAQRYHVVVSTSRYFTQLVKEATDVRAPTLSLEDMPAGRYFWQVKAIDGKGRTSSFSDPYQFMLVSQNPQAARSLDIFLDEVNHLGGTHYELKGRAGAGAQVKINGKAANVDGDGRFRCLITLNGNRVIVVEAEDQSGSRGRLVRRV
jgi:hypothetical protein